MRGLKEAAAIKEFCGRLRFATRSVFFLSFFLLADTHLGEDEMREVIEFLETKEIEACGTPAYKDPAARALKAGVLIVWDPDHLQAKRDGKGEVVIEEVERGRIVRVEMEDVASGLEWTQIGVYMPVRGQAVR